MKKIYLALVLTALSLSAHAAPGVYFGAGIGNSSADVSTSGVAADRDAILAGAVPAVVPLSTSTRKNDNDSIARLFAGFRFNNYLAIEVGFIDFGRVSATASANLDPAECGLSSPPCILTVSARLEADAFSASVLGAYPVTPVFSVYARGGVYRWDAKVRENARLPDNGAIALASASDSGTDGFYGAGLSWNINSNSQVRLEFEQYKDLGSNKIGGSSDIDVLSLSALYQY